ncbi:MAG: ribosome biogenesis factor YjgA [Neisseriaceae bacterium]
MLEHTGAVLSKTKLKKNMEKLQRLGERLIALSKTQRAEVCLPEPLQEAIEDVTRISSNSALRRQVQYIGRLMRELDQEEVQLIINYFEVLDGKHHASTAHLKRLERTRDLLIKDPAALTQYVNCYPQLEVTRLRALIRKHKRQQELGKPLTAYREIFQLIRSAETFTEVEALPGKLSLELETT